MVIGGAGFVGSHVVDSLVEHGADKVVVVDNMHLGKIENLVNATKKGNVVIYREDARYLSALRNIICLEKPELVYNLAVKCLPYGFVDPEGSFMTGVEIAQNLANILREKKFERLIHFSSSEAYGTAKYSPMDENHPLDPTTPYGAGKVAADLLLLTYRKLFGIDVSILRPFNFYGERQNMEQYAAVIPVTINRILSGQKPIIEGDGLQTRDFTYVKDGAEIAIKMMDNDESLGKAINIGQGKEINIKTVITTICKLLGYKGQIEHRPERVSDVRRLIAGISLAKEILHYSPTTDFDSGIKLTINWFKLLLENKSKTCEIFKIAESISG
jgi:UDP-glucose 4-epimerase